MLDIWSYTGSYKQVWDQLKQVLHSSTFRCLTRQAIEKAIVASIAHRLRFALHIIKACYLNIMSDHEDTAPPTPMQHDPRVDRPSICGADEVEPPYPIYMKGPVQHGFKRGSKDLGCPTGTFESIYSTSLVRLS